MLNEGRCQEDRRRQVGLQQRPSLRLAGLRRHHQIVRAKAGSDPVLLPSSYSRLVQFIHPWLPANNNVSGLCSCSTSWRPWQLESLKRVLFEFYGEEPLRSPDLSRVVNSNHFNRLMALIDDYSVSGNVAFGGQIDERRL